MQPPSFFPVVSGEQLAQVVALQLLKASIPFMCEPLPHNEWQFEVKYEATVRVKQIIDQAEAKLLTGPKVKRQYQVCYSRTLYLTTQFEIAIHPNQLDAADAMAEQFAAQLEQCSGLALIEDEETGTVKLPPNTILNSIDANEHETWEVEPVKSRPGCNNIFALQGGAS